MNSGNIIPPSKLTGWTTSPSYVRALLKTVSASAHVHCGRYGCDCVCFSRWVPMFQKSTLFQTFESALDGGVGDVHRPGSVASYGQRRQKVIQTHLRTHLKNRSDSFFTALMCTELCLTT